MSPCLWRASRYVFIRPLIFHLHVNGLPPLCSPNPLPSTFSLSLVKHCIQDKGFGHFCDHFAKFSWVFPMSCCCSGSKLCPTLCYPMNCSTPDSSVLHYFLGFAQTHVHWLSDAIQTSHPILPLLLPSIFFSNRVFSNESALRIGGQSIGVSASASVLPMNIQGWIPLGWTGLISLKSKRLSRVFSSITIQKHHMSRSVNV